MNISNYVSSLTKLLVVFIFTSRIPLLFFSFLDLFRCLCSDDSDYSDKSEAMCQFFLQLGHHHHTQQSAQQSSHKCHRRKVPIIFQFTLSTQLIKQNYLVILLFFVVNGELYITLISANLFRCVWLTWRHHESEHSL